MNLRILWKLIAVEARFNMEQNIVFTKSIMLRTHFLCEQNNLIKYFILMWLGSLSMWAQMDIIFVGRFYISMSPFATDINKASTNIEFCKLSDRIQTFSSKFHWFIALDFFIYQRNRNVSHYIAIMRNFSGFAIIHTMNMFAIDLYIQERFLSSSETIRTIIEVFMTKLTQFSAIFLINFSYLRNEFCLNKKWMIAKTLEHKR